MMSNFPGFLEETRPSELLCECVCGGGPFTFTLIFPVVLTSDAFPFCSISSDFWSTLIFPVVLTLSVLFLCSIFCTGGQATSEVLEPSSEGFLAPSFVPYSDKNWVLLFRAHSAKGETRTCARTLPLIAAHFPPRLLPGVGMIRKISDY